MIINDQVKPLPACSIINNSIINNNIINNNIINNRHKHRLKPRYCYNTQRNTNSSNNN
jgi:hypothetical protein